MPNFFTLKTVAAPESGTRTVIDFDAPGTTAMAAGDSAAGDLYCGQCGALMVAGVPKQNLKNSVIRCKLCRAFNDPGEIVISTT